MFPPLKLAIVVQGKVLYDGGQPMGIDQYPFVVTFAYYYPELPHFALRLQGIVRGLRDSQYLYNRRKLIELDILESQINSGYIYHESALVNPKDIFLSGQGRGLAIKDDVPLAEGAIKIEAPGIPQSMIELSKILGEEISQISGVNEELLGSAVDDKAGILSMLRQGAGLTTLQILFDNLDHTQKLLGKIMIDLIQANFTPGKIKKILEGDEPTDQFYNKAFGKYDAVVEEGMNTSTQKQMAFAQLLQLKELGVPIPDDILLEQCTLQDKDKLIKVIQQNQQAAQQAQQQQMESQIQLQQAQAELAKARAAADQGLGLERISRVEENEALAVERRAAAVRDEDAGLLEKVKALKEIDDMDLGHLERLITLSQMLRTQPEETAGGKTEMENDQAEGVGEVKQNIQSQMPSQQQQETNPLM